MFQRDFRSLYFQSDGSEMAFPTDPTWKEDLSKYKVKQSRCFFNLSLAFLSLQTLLQKEKANISSLKAT